MTPAKPCSDPTSKVEHIEPTTAAPGISGADVFRYLPLLMKLIEAFSTGTGTFSTNTPVGKRWIRSQDHEFPEVT